MYLSVKKYILNAFPIIKHVNIYTTDSSVWIQDIIAGVTVGLTLIPQSIAYAALAGLSPQFGLYSSLVGGLIYMIFGTIAELNIAPTALLSLLTFSYTHESPFGRENAAILLCFVSGVTELLCGLLHLGFLIDFVSTPVVAGFTSAAALTIAFSQLKNILGLKFQAETITDVLKNIFTQSGDAKLWDTTLGICCCVFLLGFREMKKFGVSPQDVNKSKTTRNQLIWFLSVSRNALVVIISACLSFTLATINMEPFSLTSEIEPGFPAIAPPLLLHSNATHSTLDMLSQMGSGVLVVPLVAILGNVAIAKAFSGGHAVDASQEMMALGLCNIVGAFFGSMPVNASFSRGAVSNASGVRTPINGFYTVVLVILALGFLTPYFALIPKATLAAVIIMAVIFMVEIDMCRNIWKINKLDFVPLSLTFFASVFFGIEVGILCGIAVNMAVLLYFAARPKVALRSLNGCNNVKIEACALLYPLAEHIKDRIMTKLSMDDNVSDVKVVVLDCADCLLVLLDDFSASGKKLVIFKLKAKLKDALLRASDAFVLINSDAELDEFLQTLCMTGNHNDGVQRDNNDQSAYVNSVYIHDNDQKTTV